MIKTLIFDFDGVLADSFNTFYPLIRGGMNQIGLDVTSDQYRNFFIGNVHQGFKDFINNEEKYLTFSEFRKNNYNKYYYDPDNKAKLFLGAAEFLKKISKKYILTIVSSGYRDNVVSLLEENGVRDLFGLIFADMSYTKEGMIKEALYKFHTKAEESVMVSDTVGDIAVAKKVGLKTIAVTWGFHSLKMLKNINPDFIANDFKELRDGLTDV